MAADKVTADEIANRSIASLWEGDAATQQLGMKIIAAKPGCVSMEMKVRDDMLNGHDICHGGYIFTLADSCFAFACNSRNDKMVAQQCSIIFSLPVESGTLLTAHAKETYRQGRTGIYDVVVSNEAGDIIANFRGLARQIKGTHLDIETHNEIQK